MPKNCLKSTVMCTMLCVRPKQSTEKSLSTTQSSTTSDKLTLNYHNVQPMSSSGLTLQEHRSLLHTTYSIPTVHIAILRPWLISTVHQKSNSDGSVDAVIFCVQGTTTILSKIIQARSCRKERRARYSPTTAGSVITRQHASQYRRLTVTYVPTLTSPFWSTKALHQITTRESCGQST